MSVREITPAEAKLREGRLIGVIAVFGQVTYYAADTLDEWRTFVRKRLGWY